MKVDDMVSFPCTLDLSNMLLDPELSNYLNETRDAHTEIENNEFNNKKEYELYGLVEHSGTLHGGHYISYVRVDGVWYYCSDSFVRVANEAEVYNAKPYLLFYDSENGSK